MTRTPSALEKASKKGRQSTPNIGKEFEALRVPASAFKDAMPQQLLNVLNSRRSAMVLTTVYGRKDAIN